jgi:hypothetical protein
VRDASWPLERFQDWLTDALLRLFLDRTRGPEAHIAPEPAIEDAPRRRRLSGHRSAGGGQCCVRRVRGATAPILSTVRGWSRRRWLDKATETACGMRVGEPAATFVEGGERRAAVTDARAQSLGPTLALRAA